MSRPTLLKVAAIGLVLFIGINNLPLNNADARWMGELEDVIANGPQPDDTLLSQANETSHRQAKRKARLNQGTSTPADRQPGAFLKELDLTTDQKTKLKAILEKSRPQRHNTREGLMAKRKQLMTMMENGSGNKAQALALHHQIAEQHEAMMAQRISMVYDIKAILTPEQFQKFQSHMKTRKKGGFGKFRSGRAQ